MKKSAGADWEAWFLIFIRLADASPRRVPGAWKVARFREHYENDLTPLEALDRELGQ